MHLYVGGDAEMRFMCDCTCASLSPVETSTACSVLTTACLSETRVCFSVIRSYLFIYLIQVAALRLAIFGLGELVIEDASGIQGRVLLSKPVLMTLCF